MFGLTTNIGKLTESSQLSEDFMAQIDKGVTIPGTSQ